MSHNSDFHFAIEFVIACSFWYMMIIIPYIEATHGIFWFVEFHSDSSLFKLACITILFEMISNLIVQQKISDDENTTTIKQNFKRYFGKKIVFDLLAHIWIFIFLFNKEFMMDSIHHTYEKIYDTFKTKDDL